MERRIVAGRFLPRPGIRASRKGHAGIVDRRKNDTGRKLFQA